ncbi:unnamed protein product, partial [Vitis vinifera]
MHDRDIVSWNSMIAGYSQGGFYEDCKELYRKMLDSTGLRPNGVTVVSVLQACAQTNDLVFGMKVHQFIIERKVEMDVSAHNSLIGLYAKCGSLDYARELFNEMSNKDEVTYGTWNAVISGLVQNNCNEGILELVQEMQEFGFRPNAVTLSSILPTFSFSGDVELGKFVGASTASVVALPSVEVSDGGVECVICKEEMRQGRDVCELPCEHLFHWMCILPWLVKRNTCPCCRFQLPSDDVFAEIERLWDVVVKSSSVNPHGESREKGKEMIACGNVDAKWSEKKMEEDDRLRTLECLRGRLLAERVASRTAKEDAELMSNKLIELESKLKTEIKARNRAEKRLKFLMKKLDSLKIPFASEGSEQSSSSDNSEISCQSSITSSATKNPEEKESKSQIPNSPKCEIEEKLEKPDSPTISQDSTELQSNPSSKDIKNDEHSSGSQKSSEAEMEINGDMNEEENIDNSLALVPVSIPTESPVEVDVGEVLAALRHAREKIQRSMGTRHMINVGSIGTRIC